MTTGKQRLTFISYSSADKEFAMELARELRSSGFRIWLDQLDIPTGRRWDDEVEKALTECDIFMIILTPDSIASNNVKDEIGYALDSNKRIMPILLENVALPFRLRRFQYIDFTRKNKKEGIEAAKQLLRTLETEPTVPSPLSGERVEAEEPDIPVRSMPPVTKKPPKTKAPQTVANLSARPSKTVLRRAAAIAATIMLLALCGFAVVKIAPILAERFSEKPPVASGEKVKIRWFVGLGTGSEPAQLPAQEKAVADLNASQDEIELILEVVPYDSARDTFSTQIASGKGPDIIGPVGWAGSNAFYGQWLDMGPYIQSAGFDASVFEPALIDYYQTEEGQVGLPFIVFPAAVYYVPALFDKAGLNYPPDKYGESYKWPAGNEEEWSWNTLAKVARRLTIDQNGRNHLDTGFDPNHIVQYGYAPQWQTHLNYQASYIAGAYPIVTGNDKGNYRANIPGSWKTASKWIYDGMWGLQPFIPTGPRLADPEFGNGNIFSTGKIAMTTTPLWYTCCLDEFRDAGFEFQAAVLPLGLDGRTHGRVDADTIRIWKGTKHPEEAFKALSYLVGPKGLQTLLVGSNEIPAAYSGLPANPKFQKSYIDSLVERYPFTTTETWNVFKAGLAYPDHPNAEQWQPNYNEAWIRQQLFFDLLQNTPPDQFNLDVEWEKMVNDLNEIYNK